MVRNSVYRAVKIVLAVSAVAILGACASDPAATPEQVVLQRAGARWQYLLTDKFGEAYKMSTPEYRKATSLEQFKAGLSGPVKWLGAEVIKVSCAQPDSCTVRLKIDVRASAGLQFSGTFSNALDEAWVLEEGQWWFKPRL